MSVNKVCVYKMVYNVILMNEYEKECNLRKPLEAAGGLTSRANKCYASSKRKSKCDVSCLI